MARPQIDIDKGQFEKLCALHCTEQEVADFFDCSPDTIDRWCKRTYKNEKGKSLGFAEVFSIKRNKGKISLRRNQWKLSEKNANMAIWLGKQYLGQSDKPEENIDTEDSEAYFNEAGLE